MKTNNDIKLAPHLLEPFHPTPPLRPDRVLQMNIVKKNPNYLEFIKIMLIFANKIAQMKTPKFLLFILFTAQMILLPSNVSAEPADPSIRRVIKLPDGRRAEAVLQGDEYGSYWRLNDGSGLCFYETQKGEENVFLPIDSAETRKMARLRRAESAAAIRHHAPRVLEGKLKVPVILAQFVDVKFQTGHTQSLFDRMCNESGFSDGDFKGSVRDYFLSQSNGKMELQFDVYGPVTLPKTASYYGEDSENNKQVNIKEFVKETIAKTDKKIDFSQYDWDGDGIVEQFIIIYAGLGQSVGGGTETIWAHKGVMGAEVHDGVVLNDYCCAYELRMKNGNASTNGIGTICHEFSHCLGLPDMYDGDNVNYGTQCWDLMATGCHNDNGFTPAGYTGYDKMALGWQQPIVLENNCQVKGMSPMSQNGNFYMIKNDNYPDEYYLLENRQQTGWDAGITGHGLLVLHVDYDPAFFNNPNKTKNTDNTHPRCAIINADNDESIGNNKVEALSGDLFGYKNHQLTNTSKPAANLYNLNIDGTLLMGKPVTNIYETSAGNISFDFNNEMINKDTYMLGCYDLKLQYASDNSVKITATIKNFSSKSYKRKLGAYVYGDGAWQSRDFVTMNLEPQESKKVTFTLEDLKDDVDYSVALYYYESDAASNWTRISKTEKFTMNDRNQFNLSVVGEPVLSVTSDSTAMLDVQVYNDSFAPYSRFLGVYLWNEGNIQKPRAFVKKTINSYSDMSCHFDLSGLDPDIVYNLYIYYYTDNSTSSWSTLHGPLILCSGTKNKSFLPGDVNHDGNVNTDDILSLVRVIEGNNAGITRNNADVNGDGQVNVADIVAVANIIAGKF
jgi:M6 family metalloprotease-like protein